MRRDACHNRSFEESPSFARLQPIAKPHATRSFGLVERSGPDRKAGVFLCHFFLKSRFYMPQLCSVALNVFRLPCEKIRGFWPRNRILARNPPASEEKDILLQQKPRSAKSTPVKMWRIVPERGLVAIFGPILATEPRSGTDRPPQERVRKSRPGLLSEIPFTRLPNLAFSCQNAVSWPKIAITPTWKGVQHEKGEESEGARTRGKGQGARDEEGKGRNAPTTTSRPTI